MSEIIQEPLQAVVPEPPKRRGRKPGARLDRTNTQSLEARLRRFASLLEETSRELKAEADTERERQTVLIDTLTKAVLKQ